MHSIAAASLGLLATQALALPAPDTSIKSLKVLAPHFTHREPESLDARADGNITAKDDGGGWIININVGGQTMTQNIDTGSSDLWVASTLLPANEQALVKTGHPVYNVSKSTTKKPISGESFSIAYGDGSGSSGPEYTEMVGIGGAQLPNFAIGVANSLKLGSGQTSRDTDGPVGLGFKSLNTARPTQEPTFIAALISAGVVTNPLFTTIFNKGANGYLLLGCTDESKHTGTLSVVPVDNSTGFWFLDNLTFGVKGTAFASVAGLNTIADTGGPGLDIPTAAVNDYFSNVPGAAKDSGGTWTYPCGTTLPDLDVFFPKVNSGPKSVAIPGAALENGSGSAGQACYTWIGNAGTTGSLGIPFFSSMYVEWRPNAPTMSIARQA